VYFLHQESGSLGLDKGTVYENNSDNLKTSGTRNKMTNLWSYLLHRQNRMHYKKTK